MEIRNKAGIDPARVEDAINKAGWPYGGNPTAVDSRSTGRTSMRTRVAVRDSRGPGARRSASGRRGRYACWHAYRDAIRAILTQYPDAVIRTGMAVYRGREGFEQAYPQTAYKNIGSQVFPAYMPDLCDCDDEGL